MTVSSTSSTGSTSSTSSSSTNPYSTLGAADYLKLLTTEMQNQDPTAPVDETQEIAQMAQFTTLSATEDMDTKMGTISTTLDSILSAQQAAGSSTSSTSGTTSTDGTTSTGSTSS